MCVLGVFTVRMAINGHQQIMRSDCVLMRSCTILAESESSAATEQTSIHIHIHVHTHTHTHCM